MPRPVTALESLQTGLVAPGVHAIYSTYGDNKPLIVYVLEGEFTLWVDAGIDITPRQHVIPYLRKHAPRAWEKPQKVLITHADVDHFGGVAELRKAHPNVEVLSHGTDKPWIESPERILRERYEMHARDGIRLTPERKRILNERGGGGTRVDRLVHAREILPANSGNWKVLSAAGHTPGHVVLWNEASGDLIIGDAVLDWGVPNARGDLLAPPPYYDLPAYEATIAMLRALAPRRVFTSHQGILGATESAALFDQSLEATRTLSSATEDALRASPRGLTLADLAAEVGRRSKVWPAPLWPGLADPVSAHLKVALSGGEVVRDDATGRYRLAR
jgi:glyoxylase-like metal-dependent hydrolase (beta-lactamase superfamily II)